MTAPKPRLTDDEILALKCPDCGKKLYDGIPELGFTPQQRVRQKARCDACRREKKLLEERIRSNKKRNGGVYVPSQARETGDVTRVGSQECGHRWAVKTSVPMSVLMNGGTKLKCPECDAVRRVYSVAKLSLDAGKTRCCDECGKGLSTYNPGPTCWACELRIADEIQARIMEGVHAAA